MRPKTNRLDVLEMLACVLCPLPCWPAHPAESLARALFYNRGVSFSACSPLLSLLNESVAFLIEQKHHVPTVPPQSRPARQAGGRDEQPVWRRGPPPAPCSFPGGVHVPARLPPTHPPSPGRLWRGSIKWFAGRRAVLWSLSGDGGEREGRASWTAPTMTPACGRACPRAPAGHLLTCPPPGPAARARAGAGCAPAPRPAAASSGRGCSGRWTAAAAPRPRPPARRPRRTSCS